MPQPSASKYACGAALVRGYRLPYFPSWVRLVLPVWPQEWESLTRPAIDSFHLTCDQFNKVTETGIPLFQQCFNTAYIPSLKLLELIEDSLPFDAYNHA